MTTVHERLVTMPVAPIGSTRELRRLSLVRAPRYEQGMLALTYPLPTGVDAVPGLDGDGSGGPSTGSAEVPDLKGWAGRFVQGVIEVIAQERPASQLARWTAADVYADVIRLQRAAAAQPRDPTARPARQAVASVRVFRVASDAAEVAARINGGLRSRAVAARLDYQRGRWTCTALSVG
jgi:hypothetical protein